MYVCTVLLEDPSSVFGAHVVELTVLCNFISRDSVGTEVDISILRHIYIEHFFFS